MVEIHVSEAEAVYLIDTLRKQTKTLIESIMYAIDEEQEKKPLPGTLLNNALTNATNHIAALEKELESKSYGLKKDGTPKKRPGRKPGSKKAKK